MEVLNKMVTNKIKLGHTMDWYQQNLADLRLVGNSIEEQETIVLIRRDSDTASVETTDPTEFTDLRKKALNGEWTLTSVEHSADETNPLCIVAATFEADKRLMNYRARRLALSDERRAALSEQVRQMRKEQA